MKSVLLRSVVAFALLSLLALFSGCIEYNIPADPTAAPEATDTAAPTEAVTEEPTEAPTEAPTAVPTAEPTVDPTEPPAEDFKFAWIMEDAPARIDVDCDGVPDTVTIASYDAGWGYEVYTVTIQFWAHPGEVYTFESDPARELLCAAAADCDPDDGHVEIFLSLDLDDYDFITYAIRMKDGRRAFDFFYESMAFGEADYGGQIGMMYPPSPDMPCRKRTNVLGDCFVTGSFTVTADGIVETSDEYFYPDNGVLMLKRDMELTLPDGSRRLVKEGEIIRPYSTDRRTWVKVKLDDGTVGKAAIEVDFDGGPVYINGIEQTEYAVFPYFVVFYGE